MYPARQWYPVTHVVYRKYAKQLRSARWTIETVVGTLPKQCTLATRVRTRDEVEEVHDETGTHTHTHTYKKK